MRSIRIVAAAWPLLFAFPAGAQSSPTREAEFDAYVAKAVSDWHMAGLAIAVVKDGKVQFSKGYGVRELGKSGPVDTNTVFAIASTTKAMTAAALAMLVDEGKVKWDDPVTKYIPAFQLNDPYVTREVTIRDLLTHRTGLGNADYLWGLSDLTPTEMIGRLRLIKPSYSLRSSFIYQNIMYITAGEVIAAVSGMPWSKFIQTRIFAPLGMTSSYPLLSLVPLASNAAVPHFRFGGDTITRIELDRARGVTSAGDAWSNISDLTRWMKFLLDSGRVNGKPLIQPATFEELFKPQVIVPLDEFYPTAELTRPHWMTYGLGWFQHDYQGRMLDFHTGSLSGMVAIAGLVRDERFGVFVLGNVDHDEIRHALMYKAIDLYLGNPSRDWSKEFRTLYETRRANADSARISAINIRIKGTRPSLALSKYKGTYEDPLYGKIVVSERSGKLHVDAGKILSGPLEHWQYDRFRVQYTDRWQGSDIIAFTIGEGIPSALSIGDITWHRVPDPSGTATKQEM